MVVYSVDLENFPSDQVREKTYIDQVPYKIYNNDRESTDESVANYRSVIATEDKKLLCFAPPTTTPLDVFMAKYPLPTEKTPMPSPPLLINELVEGTMINLFYDPRVFSWEIATRSSIHANHWYYRMEYDNKERTQKTFRQMFLETVGGGPDATDINAVFANYSKLFCYSFVLQHPENHIVLNITQPRVFLVAVHQILSATEVRFVSPVDYESWDMFPPEVCFPARVTDDYFRDSTLKTYDEIIHNISKQTAMGLMITHLEKGERSIVINEHYEKVKAIRGNHMNLEYYYHVLRQKENGLAEFLYYFPQYTLLMRQFETQYANFITEVQNFYFLYYVKKDKTHIPKKYFIHVSRLHHTVFLPTKTVIRNSVVKQYLDAMSPKEIYMYMHYDENYKKVHPQNPNEQEAEEVCSGHGDPIEIVSQTEVFVM